LETRNKRSERKETIERFSQSVIVINSSRSYLEGIYNRLVGRYSQTPAVSTEEEKLAIMQDD
jgi:hypothetical protein